MNRAHIVKSFYRDFEIKGWSLCEDVQFLRRCLEDFHNGKTEFDCGSGGTTFRFLLARLSREQGRFVVTGSPRLLSRPHEPLVDALKDLGVQVTRGENKEYIVESEGWKISKPLNMNSNISTQFISAILLSTWNLEKDLRIKTGSMGYGLTYLSMTLDFLKSIGMQMHVSSENIFIPSYQNLKVAGAEIEPDLSSLFALVAFAIKAGQIKITNFPKESLQPDSIFLGIIENIGVDFSLDGGTLVVNKTKDLKGVNFNINKSPDLFPVLSVLMATVPKASHISGLANLQFKESDRLRKTRDLLNALGIFNHLEGDSLFIEGQEEWPNPDVGEFDPDHDHRMAMAAALAKKLGADIRITNPEVVNKSFPEFWEIVNL